jgi:hypothetical protein
MKRIEAAKQRSPYEPNEMELVVLIISITAFITMCVIVQ